MSRSSGPPAVESKRKFVARQALFWMAAAVAGYVPIPLIVWAGVRDTSPFLFVAVWYAVGAVLHALLRQVQEGRGHGRSRFVMADDLAAAKLGYLWLAALLKAEWLLFALAFTLVEPVVVTVVFEFWPVFFALFTLSGFWRRRMLKGVPKARGTRASMLVLLIVGGVGVSMAVMSDTGAAGWGATAIVGVLLAVVSAFSSALIDVTLQMMGADQRKGAAADKTAVSASGNAVAQALATPPIALAATIVWLVDSSDWWAASGLLLAAVAAAAQVAANWCFQRANHLSREAHGETGAQVNSLYYLVPVGGLLLLVWLADTTIERFDLLLIGAAGVIVVNMILHLDPEDARQRADQSGGHGYRALVLSLWAAGAAVLLRDDWLPDSWQVWSVVEYWGMIGVCATVFTLILSFRQSRLAERRRDMDELMLRIHRQLVFMGKRDELRVHKADKAIGLLREIDSARRPRELSDSYFELRQLLVVETAKQPDRERAERLDSLLADVEVLVNLRQQGRNFSELAVLTLFSALTVALSVAARPVAGAEPFAAWVHDTTSLVIAAAFTFLGFDLIDKRRKADAPTLRQVSAYAKREKRQPPGWRLELVAYQDKSVERIAVALMGAVLLAGAVAMLGVKWL